MDGVLPQAFLDAVALMRRTFATGTDVAAHAASQQLIAALHTLPPALTAAAEEHLADQGALAMGERAAYLLRAQLPDATPVGSRPLPDGTEVRTLRLPTGAEVAVVVPTGDDEASCVRRSALLAGTCPDCGGLLEANLAVTHDARCVAAG